MTRTTVGRERISPRPIVIQCTCGRQGRSAPWRPPFGAVVGPTARGRYADGVARAVGVGVVDAGLVDVLGVRVAELEARTGPLDGRSVGQGESVGDVDELFDVETGGHHLDAVAVLDPVE